MAYLEIGLESSGVVVGDDPNRVVVIDYSHVTTASTLAQRAFEDANATAAEKELANAIHSLVGILSEIVSGMDHGRVTVHNYPGEGTHLER